MRINLESDWVRGLLMSVIIIGVLLALLGVQQFVDASLRIQANPVYQREAAQDEITLDSSAEARGLIAAGIEYQELVSQRNRGLIIGGSGLVLLALGWIMYDYARARQQKQTVMSVKHE